VIFVELNKLKRFKMTYIDIFDGHKSPKYGRVLNNVLTELGRVQSPNRVFFWPKPGEIGNKVQDQTFVAANRIAKSAMNRAGRVNLTQLVNNLYSSSNHFFQDLDVSWDQGTQKIILLPQDFYAEKIAWCFGQYIPIIDTVILSSKRVKREKHWEDLLAHEIGHMYGAAPRGRTNTIELLGSHCTNNLCVMQQKITAEDSERYALQRNNLRAPTYCGQCTKDIKNSRR